MTVEAPEGAVSVRAHPLSRPSTWAIVVWVATAAYAFALAAESIHQHERYTTGFDTAIFGQALWLLSHGDDPFSTIVGRPMLAGLQPGLALLSRIPGLRYVALVEGDGPIEYPRDIATVLPLVRREGFVEIYRDGRVRVLERRP